MRNIIFNQLYMCTFVLQVCKCCKSHYRMKTVVEFYHNGHLNGREISCLRTTEHGDFYF